MFVVRVSPVLERRPLVHPFPPPRHRPLSLHLPPSLPMRAACPLKLLLPLHFATSPNANIPLSEPPKKERDGCDCERNEAAIWGGVLHVARCRG